MHEIDGPAGTRATVTLTTPLADDGTIEDGDRAGAASGALVAVGLLAAPYRRLVISAVEWQSDMTAQITLVDEAAALWA